MSDLGIKPLLLNRLQSRYSSNRNISVKNRDLASIPQYSKSWSEKIDRLISENVNKAINVMGYMKNNLQIDPSRESVIHCVNNLLREGHEEKAIQLIKFFFFLEVCLTHFFSN